MSFVLVLFVLAALSSISPISPASPASAASGVPTSPFRILHREQLVPPLLDAVTLCVPRGLDEPFDAVVEKAASGDWKEARRALEHADAAQEAHPEAADALSAEIAAREATTREARRAADAELTARILDPVQKDQTVCLRLERARILMLLERLPEASAQLAHVSRALDRSDPWDRARLAGVAFWRAEILYRMGRRFDAHMAFRKLATAESPRIALAARLRLSDLAFDVGKTGAESLEYETLLPRATAFGATLDGWSLRAAEAALEEDDPTRALHWLERFVAGTRERDVRDLAEIRRADLEVRLQDPLAASARLKEIVGRRAEDPIGTLAAVRAIDLGVFDGAVGEEAKILDQAIRRHRYGLRRYALDVLARRLAAEESPDRAIAVATRLAYEGIDPSVVPGFTATLDGLLARVAAGGDEGCDATLRALGGRYVILIERASSWGPFAQLGRCFERMEAAWLALPVYQAIGRRFGPQGADAVALPLARASLAAGEVPLARHMADAALAQAPSESAPWQAILAEADFLENRASFAILRTRKILDAGDLDLQRSRLAVLLARSFAKGRALEDARFLAARLPTWLAEPHGEKPTADRLRLLEAAMTTAHVLRRANEAEAAFALYRAIDRASGEGPLRSSARFWLGLARQDLVGGEPAWGKDVEKSLGAPWAPVAAFEEHYEKLRDIYAGVLR